MATILCVSTAGHQEPARASLPFVTAVRAVEAGHRAQILLVADAPYLMKDSFAREVYGTCWPPLVELLHRVVDHGIPIYV